MNTKQVNSSIRKAYANIKSGAQRGIATAKTGTQSGIANLKSGYTSVKSSTQAGYASVMTRTQTGLNGLAQGISDVVDHTPQAVTSRRGAFSEAFKTTVTSFTRKGANLPATFLDGAAAKVASTPKSWKATGAVRNLLAKATQVGIGAIEIVTALGGAFLGVIAGLGAGAKAFATYKKPVANPTTQPELQPLTSHPVSAPDSPASPSAVKVGVAVSSQNSEYVGVTLTPQEQKAAA